MNKHWMFVVVYLIANTTFAATFEESICPKEVTIPSARCGFLFVPENRSKPESPTIRLAVTFIPSASKNPAPDPIVYMAGGPGGSARPAAAMLVKAGINKDRNLIIMDQRGTTYSQPALLCPEIDAVYARTISMRYDSNEAGKLRVAAASKCYERLKAKGIDLSAYNTTENAADFADLRTALKIKAWNVYGVSYGTDLALTYMTHHPEGVRSVVIDSVVPPNSVSLGMFWVNAHVGLDNIFSACDGNYVCHAHYANSGLLFQELVRKFENKPLVDTVKPVLIPGEKPAANAKAVKVVMDGGAFANWVIGMTEMLGPQLPAILQRVSKGNTRDVLASYAVTGIAHAGDMSYGLLHGVACSEWIPYEAENIAQTEGKRMFPAFPASVLAQSPQFPSMKEICKVWRVDKAPSEQRDIMGDIPVLVIAGSYDAITSTKFAEATEYKLRNARLVIIPGIGHFVVPKSKCAQQVMQSFLVDPMKLDDQCAKRLKVIPFKIEY